MFYLIQKMEDMDIDSLVDIPDTPDRLSSRKMNRGDCIEKESNLSVAGHVGGSNTVGEGSLDRIQGRGKLVAENGHNRNHYIHPQKLSDSVDESERWKNTIVLSPQEKARENASSLGKQQWREAGVPLESNTWIKEKLLALNCLLNHLDS